MAARRCRAKSGHGSSISFILSRVLSSAKHGRPRRDPGCEGKPAPGYHMIARIKNVEHKDRWHTCQSERSPRKENFVLDFMSTAKIHLSLLTSPWLTRLASPMPLKYVVHQKHLVLCTNWL